MTQYRTFSLKRKQQLLFLLDGKRVFYRTYPSANPTLYLTVNFCWVREVVGAQLLTDIDQKPQRLPFLRVLLHLSPFNACRFCDHQLYLPRIFRARVDTAKLAKNSCVSRINNRIKCMHSWLWTIQLQMTYLYRRWKNNPTMMRRTTRPKIAPNMIPSFLFLLSSVEI